MDADEELDAAIRRMQLPMALEQRQVDDVKSYATLQARAALAGFELVRMPGGDYVVGRWGMVRALSDVEQLEAFLQQVGAPGA